MTFTNQLFCGLCGPSDDDYLLIGQQNSSLQIIDEKPALHPQLYRDEPDVNVEKLAADIVAILRKAEKRGEVLTRDVDGVVSAAGWSEWLAQNVLKGIVHTLESGREKMGPAMVQAYDDAVVAAKKEFAELYEFVQEHPTDIAAAVLITILAFGVLVVMAPVILELLGFSELGPVEGSFAAWWQTKYLGHVPKGSVFSFFQRLGSKKLWGHFNREATLSQSGRRGH